MKFKRILFICCLIFSAMSAAYGQTDRAPFLDTVAQVTCRAEAIRAEWEDASSKNVLVVAHRAAWKKAPENSQLAVRHAIEMGVDIIEIDIRKTKDGKFILMHDAGVNRTTNGKGAVKDLTLNELKALRLKGVGGKLTDEQIPTLSEVLLLAKGEVLINLDKAWSYIEEILPILEATGTTRQVILKGRLKPDEISELIGDNPNIIYMPIFDVTEKAQKPDTPTDELECDALYPIGKGVRSVELIFKQVDNPCVSKTVMQELKQKNVRAWVNTLEVCHPSGYSDGAALKNLDKVWGHLIEKGFSIIQTDEPRGLLDYLKNRKLHE